MRRSARRLVQPTRGGRQIGWIPALRFPTWMRCLGCGLMHSAPWRRSPTKDGSASTSAESDPRYAERCGVCGGTLEQAPWVLVHEDGYLADVPWHDLAHADSRNPEQVQCGRDWSWPYLALDETGVRPSHSLHPLPCVVNPTIPNAVPVRHLATTLDAGATVSTPGQPRCPAS